jgi:hypothetical protein
MAQLFSIRLINGQVPPIPKSLVATRYTLDSDSYRSASGLLIRNPIANKMKFELEFSPMNKAELQSLLSMMDSEKFEIAYEDIITGSINYGNFYHNDFSIKPIWIKNDENTNVIHDVFSINLIEY